MNPIWRVSSYLFRYKSLFGTTLFMAVLMTIAQIWAPQIINNEIDRMHTSHDLTTLPKTLLIIASIFAVREFFNFLRIRFNNVLEQKVLMDLRRDLHSKLLKLPISFYDKRKSGDIASRVIEDVANLERVLLDGSEQGIVAILTIIGVTISMFFKSPQLAFFTLLPIPLLVFLGRKYGKRAKDSWKDVRNASGELNSLVIEDIQGNRLIQSFALTQREHQRFEDKSHELKAKTLITMFRWSIYSPLNHFISHLGLVAVTGYGGYLLATDAENFTVGTFVAFLMLNHMFQDPIRVLMQLNHMFSTGKASGERVYDIIDHPVDIESPEKPDSFPSGDLAVQYDHVTFSYKEREQIIDELNIELPAGQVTALVGHTGAGKSTIANLLLRYYDTHQGAVRINGKDIKNLNLSELRSNIGIVSQDPFLFDCSIRDNMLIAKQHASDEDIWNALDSASIKDFIQSLPDQLDTPIGERGIRLSMGERQRITIARVLLKNPPIVILDEATSSVDTLTERKIQDGLDRLMKNRTVLIIAHRLSTVKKADQIIVLDKGKVSEKGTHQSLIQSKGIYNDLWTHQLDTIPE